MTECLTVAPTVRLHAIQRERRTRREGAYLAEDKHRRLLILTQKLPVLAAHLNSLAKDRADCVSVPALYANLGATDNRVGGFTKHRWKVTRASFEEACARFEEARGRFDQAVILGPRACYRLKRP